AEHWQQQLEQAVEQARNAETTMASELQNLRTQYVQIGAELKAQQERLQALQSEDNELTQKIADWRARHPELDDGGLEDLLRVDDTQVSELRQRLQHNEKAIEQAKVLLQERDQRLLAH